MNPSDMEGSFKDIIRGWTENEDIIKNKGGIGCADICRNIICKHCTYKL